MADKELAAKLAKRLAAEKTEDNQEEVFTPPPPVPVIPQKIIENPYVAVDNTVSIDDLILRTLEKQEENNNNNNNNNTVSPSSPKPADVPSRREDLKSPPPKTSIRDLIIKEHQHDPTATTAQPKSPFVPVEHHRKTSAPVRKLSPETDGSELERKLAAQRAKKSVSVVSDEKPNLIYSNVAPNDAATSSTTVENVPVSTPNSEVDQEKNAEISSVDQMAQEILHTGIENVQKENDQPTPVKVETPPVTAVEEPTRKSSFEELEEMFEKELQEASQPTEVAAPAPLETTDKDQKHSTAVETEAEKQPIVEEKLEPALLADSSAQENIENQKTEPVEPKTSSNVAAETSRKILNPEATIIEKEIQRTSKTTDDTNTFVPTPQLIELIRAESGVKSPPPVPPPKPNTPTHSRPQSPVVKKLSISPLGLMCDPLMSVDAEKTVLCLSPPPVAKSSTSKEENPEELAALLERRAKINEGEAVPEFINRKLSLYAEFSEFSRKQIKFFSDTFKKYDEDQDGFIDFNELKRMMEKMGEAQTHIALKEIIRKVDEDEDQKISLREFHLIFRLAAQGHLACSEVFTQLAESVDVAKEGVLGAASFFQAKIAEQTKLSKFEEEIREEQEERKKEEEEKKLRREKFLQSKSLFH